jgi:ligand-binding sensor domain-containing protein
MAYISPVFTSSNLKYIMRSRIKLSGILLLIPITFVFLLSPVLAKRLPVNIFTSADGLGSGFVDNIYRDSRGFMWFCTRDGLSRFDGSRFVTYRIGDTASPPGIEVIFETRAGDYYVSTTGGTFRLRPDVISEHRSSFDRAMTAEFLFGARGSFHEDKTGNLWINYGPLSRLVERDGKTELVRYPLDIPTNENRPLQILGVADRLGSIEVGKMANVVVTDGDNLDPRTNIKHMFINGRLIPLTSRHTELFDSFKDRGAKPTQ